MYDGCYKKQ